MKLRGPSEYIRATAVRFSDLGTFALPLPAKHAEVRDLVLRLHGPRSGKHRGELGFVTGAGKFVTPREALIIARHARQLKRGSIRDVGLQPENLVKMHVDTSSDGVGDTDGSEATWRPETLSQRRWVHSRPTAALATSQQLRQDFNKAMFVGLATAVGAWLVTAYLGATAWVSGFQIAVGAGASSAMLMTFIFYMLAGAGLALVLNGRGSAWRSAAVTACSASFTLGCAWAIAAHFQSGQAALLVMAAALIADVASIGLAVTVRPVAAALLAPKMLWMAVLLYGGVLSQSYISSSVPLV